MSQYSPFDKSITDLQPSDLAVLKFVSEGWYVDYKRDLIDSGGMAKALSAFANTYGGWLFFGVSELSKFLSGKPRFERSVPVGEGVRRVQGVY